MSDQPPYPTPDGLSLRDYLAAQVAGDMLQLAHAVHASSEGSDKMARAAEGAYYYADELLAARDLPFEDAGPCHN